MAKVIFLHLSVILFTGGMCLRQTPPQEQTPPLEQTPPWSRHPPWEKTPRRADTPPGADTHPREQTPPADTPHVRHPLGQTPHLGCRLRHTVNERPVRILLECVLVLKCNRDKKKFRFRICFPIHVNRS